MFKEIKTKIDTNPIDPPRRKSQPEIKPDKSVFDTDRIERQQKIQDYREKNCGPTEAGALAYLHCKLVKTENKTTELHRQEISTKLETLTRSPDSQGGESSWRDTVTDYMKWGIKNAKDSFGTLSKLINDSSAKKAIGRTAKLATILAFTMHATLQVEAKSAMGSGDSVASGYGLPKGAFAYPKIFFEDLKAQDEGFTDFDNIARPGETVETYQDGKTLFHPPGPSQLDDALKFFQAYPGQVEVVTLQIGGNDALEMAGWDRVNRNCDPQLEDFDQNMEALDKGLDQILTGLHKAMNDTKNNASDLIMLNYYNPFQKECSNIDPYFQKFSKHLAKTAEKHNTILVDITPLFTNNTICDYTSMCSPNNPDFHPTPEGHQAIARKLLETYKELKSPKENDNEQKPPNDEQKPHDGEPKTPNDEQKKQNDNNWKFIVGATVGGGGALLIAGSTAFYLYKKRNQNQDGTTNP